MDSWPALWRLLSHHLLLHSRPARRARIYKSAGHLRYGRGIGLILGPIGLLALLKRRNKEIDDESQTAWICRHPVALADRNYRAAPARVAPELGDGTLLIVHLGLVMTLF